MQFLDQDLLGGTCFAPESSLIVGIMMRRSARLPTKGVKAPWVKLHQSPEA